jgi:hypothetical protein
MKIPAAANDLPALIDEGRACARFLSLIRFAPSTMCQGRSSVSARILRQAHPTESGLRCRVIKELCVAVKNITAELQLIDQPGIRMPAT